MPSIRTWFQYILGLALLVLVYPLLSEFFIEWARENGWYSAPSQRVHEMVGFVESVTHNWYFPIFLGVLSAFIVTLVDGAINRRETAAVKQKRLLMKEVRVGKEQEQSWRQIYRKRDEITINEAAFMLADIEPSDEEPKGAARGYAETIRDAVRAGKIPYAIGNAPIEILLGSARTGNHEYAKWRESEISKNIRLQRDKIASFFVVRGESDEAARLGGVTSSLTKHDTVVAIKHEKGEDNALAHFNPRQLFVAQILAATSKMEDQSLFEIAIRFFNVTGASLELRGLSGHVVLFDASQVPAMRDPSIGYTIENSGEGMVVLDLRMSREAIIKASVALNSPAGLAIDFSALKLNFGRPGIAETLLLPLWPEIKVKFTKDVPHVSRVIAGALKATL